jgi:argininosuccinate lyase
MAKKLWSGRFSEDMSKSVEGFTSSIRADARLYREDIAGSIAWANALKKAKVLSASEANKITRALKAILAGIEKGQIKLKEELEDIHMNIESLLIGKIGDTGKKLHTGRSRNDQVATDIRLNLKSEVGIMIDKITVLQKALIKIAEDNIAVVMPGYTHMQQAQPVLLSHYIMAYFEMFARDKERLLDAIKRIDVMPLGSGALAGTSYPVDRSALAKELGFKKVSANSIDAVSDRDFALEVLACNSITMMHLSRFCSELILWSTSEYGFIEISDAFTTGSSIMPQKKNPDVAELIRGKTGSAYGALISLLTTMKGLPLAYNRDLQEDKDPLFTSVDAVKASLSIFNEMVSNIRFKAEAMKLKIRKDIIATDLADYLVGKGLPFRSAHEVIGKIIAYCEKSGKEPDDLSLWDLRRFYPKIDEGVYNATKLEKSIEAKDVAGGTATKRVIEEIRKAKKNTGKTPTMNCLPAGKAGGE